MRKTLGYIAGSWSSTKVYCMNEEHSEPVEMPLDSDRTTLSYRCPECDNMINLAEFEKMLEHLQNLIMEAEMTDTRLDLTNYTWKERYGIGKGNQYKVLKHKDLELEVGVFNPKAVAK